MLTDVRVLVKARVEGDASRRAPLFKALAGDDLKNRMAAGERPSAEEVYDQVVAPLLGQAQRPATGKEAKGNAAQGARHVSGHAASRDAARSSSRDAEHEHSTSSRNDGKRAADGNDKVGDSR